MANDNVLPFLLQNALNRAFPSGPASNQVLYQFSLENDTTSIPDTVQATTRPVGYPYGWGESVTVNQSTNGTYTYSLTEPPGIAQLIKISSYQPSGSTVSLNVNSATLSPVSPAQVSWYADVYSWSAASILGTVGMSPWSTPSIWPDASACWIGPDANSYVSDAPGQWLLRKWIYCPSQQTYTVNVAADAMANVYIDGTYITQCTSSYQTNTTYVSMSSGLHLVTIEMVNYGTAPNPTGCLISILDSNGNVIENGADGQWQTTGYINHAWSYGAGAPSMVDSWYMINQPTSTNLNLSLTLGGSPSPTVNSLWIYTVAPWRWDEGGEWNATANNTLPIVVNVGGSSIPSVQVVSPPKSPKYIDTMIGVIPKE